MNDCSKFIFYLITYNLPVGLQGTIYTVRLTMLLASQHIINYKLTKSQIQ